MGLIKDFNKELSLWLNAHGISNIDVCEGSDWCYYHESHCLQWGFFEAERTENNFRQFLYEYGCRYISNNTGIMSFLHEVGHIMTLAAFDDVEMEKEFIAKDCRKPASIETNYWYWELPTEFAANSWAINWANTHPEEIKELEEIFERNLTAIYEDEDIMGQVYEWLARAEDGEEVSELTIDEDWEI